MATLPQRNNEKPHKSDTPTLTMFSSPFTPFSAAMISRKSAKFHFFHVWLFFWDLISPSSPPRLLHPIAPVFFLRSPPSQAA